jgi:hypothetical protein
LLFLAVVTVNPAWRASDTDWRDSWQYPEMGADQAYLDQQQTAQFDS